MARLSSSRACWVLAVLTVVIPLRGQNSISITCPSPTAAGSITILCPVTLSLGAGVSVDSLSLGILVTPAGSSPALNGSNVGFNTTIPLGLQNRTSTSIALMLNPNPALSGSSALGSAVIPLPGATVAGQAYSVGISGASASFSGTSVSISLGAPAAVTLIVPTVMNLTSASLNFGSQAMGTPSLGQTITVSNNGLSSFSFSLAVSGDFSQNSSCGGSIASGASCSVTVTFTPKASGLRTGALSLYDGNANSPIQVRLFGTGVSGPVGAELSLSNVALNFGGQSTGITSGSKAVTLINTGDATLTVANISASTEFAQTNNCGSLAAAATCSISVTFTPSVNGPRSGTITIVDTAAGSPHVIRLSGVGTGGSGPAAGFSAVSANFGTQTTGTTSAAQTITVTNTGNASLIISGVSATGNFGVSGCVTTLTPGTSCTLNVTFTPSASGTRRGTVSVTSNASGSPQLIRLVGQGT